MIPVDESDTGGGLITAPGQLHRRVLATELARGESPEAIARRYPDLWACGEAVRAAIERYELA